jgi:hypothetical protein
MPDSKVKLKVDFNSKLNELDNENQTYGCRQCNPDICINNMVENVCAFTRSDNICKNLLERGKINIKDY